MKTTITCTLMFLALTSVQAHAAKTVTGRASCRDGKQQAMQNAIAQCNSPVIQLSEWRYSTVECYGPGHWSWDGVETSAIFSCQVGNGSALIP